MKYFCFIYVCVTYGMASLYRLNFCDSDSLYFCFFIPTSRFFHKIVAKILCKLIIFCRNILALLDCTKQLQQFCNSNKVDDIKKSFASDKIASFKTDKNLSKIDKTIICRLFGANSISTKKYSLLFRTNHTGAAMFVKSIWYPQTVFMLQYRSIFSNVFKQKEQSFLCLQFLIFSI